MRISKSLIDKVTPLETLLLFCKNSTNTVEGSNEKESI